MEWIGISDKLPIDLGYGSADILILTTDHYIGIGWYFDDSMDFGFEVSKENADHSGQVTHWMPLPKPPTK